MIQGSLEGSYRDATGMWASYEGEWIPIPLGGGGGGLVDCPHWERPEEWLPVTIAAGDQAAQILVAVYNCDVNYVTIRASGAFHVDWGDGTPAQDVADNTKVVHNYSWANVPSSTLTSGNYRQAMATVTPQAGQTLTSLTFSDPYNTAASWHPGVAVLEITVGPSTVTNFIAYPPTGARVRLNSLHHVNFLEPFTGILRLEQAQSLYRISGESLTLTDSYRTFYDCFSLVDLPPIDISATTSGNWYTFGNCRSLYTATVTGRLVTSAQYLFYYCQGMHYAPTFDTSGVTLFRNMFEACSSLQRAPMLNTSAGTDFYRTFTTCPSMEYVPAWDCSAGTLFTDMFNGCFSLRDIDAHGFKYSFSVYRTALGKQALDKLFTNVGTASGTQSIDIRDTPGQATCDKSIATAKGWTFVG